MHFSDYNEVAFRKEFFDLTEQSEHIVITAHYSPDDDSIASVLSVYTILATRYIDKDIRIVYTGTIPQRYSIFHNFEKIEWVEDIANHIAGTDMLIVLDVNRFARISKNPETLEALTIPQVVIIDHHGTPPGPSTLSMIVPEVSSNAELVYRSLGAEDVLTKELAGLFLLGILGDTGNFAYVPPSQAGVFSIAARLVEMVGMQIDAFRSRYGGIPKEILPLLQSLVSNTTYAHVDGWPDIQYTWIDRSVMIAGNFDDEDMSAASHIYMGQYLTRIKGQSWGIVATPRADGSARISGRSLPGSVNVRALFEGMTIGGGHDRASGGYLAETDGKEGALAVLTWMQNNKPVLG